MSFLPHARRSKIFRCVRARKTVEMSSVLIVEDDAVLREILFEMFAKEHVCCAASTAERALALLSEHQFDVVLTDISMPGIGGLGLFGHVRPRWPETGGVIISGLCERAYAARPPN